MTAQVTVGSSDYFMSKDCGSGIFVGALTVEPVIGKTPARNGRRYGIVLVTEGGLWLHTSDSTRHAVPRGSYYVTTPQQSYELEVEGPVSTVYVGVCEDNLNHLALDADRDGSMPQVRPSVLNAGHMLQTIMGTMATEALQPSLGSKLMLETLCLQLGVHVLRDQQPGWKETGTPAHGSVASPDIRRTLEYIHAHYMDNLTLDELSSVAAFSRFHFLRLFKRHTGLTPHAYIRQLRIQEAASLLIHSGSSVTEIARQLSFASPSHLSDAFRRYYGASPKQFRYDHCANGWQLESN